MSKNRIEILKEINQAKKKALEEPTLENLFRVADLVANHLKNRVQELAWRFAGQPGYTPAQITDPKIIAAAKEAARIILRACRTRQTVRSITS